MNLPTTACNTTNLLATIAIYQGIYHAFPIDAPWTFLLAQVCLVLEA